MSVSPITLREASLSPDICLSWNLLIVLPSVFKIKLLEIKAKTEIWMAFHDVVRTVLLLCKPNTFHYHSYETVMHAFHCSQEFPHIYLTAVTLLTPEMVAASLPILDLLRRRDLASAC